MKKINRRQVLKSMSGLPLVTSLPSIASGNADFLDNNIIHRNPDSDADWEDVRRQFNIDTSNSHFGGFLIASHPKPVRDEIERIKNMFDKDPENTLNLQNSRYNSVKNAIGRYLDVSTRNIALTDSTTMSMSLLYTGLKINSDSEILYSNHDHHLATVKSLELLKQRNGTSLRKFNIYNDPRNITEQGIVDNVVNAVRPNTRVLALTWVHSHTGVKIPVKKISSALKTINASRGEYNKVIFCLDGVHGLGIDGETVTELGVDFFGAGTHKWMFGPRGTGILVANKNRTFSPDVVPVIPSFSSSPYTPGGFHSFEYRWALDKAFDFHQNIGKSNIGKRIHYLNRKLKEGLRSIPKVTVYTPMEDNLSAGIVCFMVRGYSVDGVIEKLKNNKIIGSPSVYVRLAPSLYTLDSDIDKVLNVIKGM